MVALKKIFVGITAMSVVGVVGIFALAKEPQRFVPLDQEGRTWLIDVPTKSACSAAAKLLSVDKKRPLKNVAPMPGDSWQGGCIAFLK